MEKGNVMEKKKVLFVINSIGYGGVERALTTILSVPELSEDFEVHLLLLDDEPIIRKFLPHVTLHVCNSKRKLLPSIVNFNKYVNELAPAVTISLLVRANVCNAIINGFLLRKNSIICERMHLSSHLAGQFPAFQNKVVKQLPKLFYRFATLALGVSTGVTSDLVENYSVKPDRAKTIFNPYNFQHIAEEAKKQPEFDLPEEFIVSVGRLTGSKNFQTLFEAYLASNEKAPLVVLGIGDLEDEFKKFIKDNNAEGRILLMGYSFNPYAIVSRAKYFIATSLNEGFPNAMAEAMVLGKPIIMSNCPSGPGEILNETAELNIEEMLLGKYGVLVPMKNEVETTKAINFMQSDVERERYASLALSRSRDFELIKIASQYWDVIKNLA